MAKLDDLDEWIEEHRREIAECPATARGYRQAAHLNWGLQRLLEYREKIAHLGKPKRRGSLRTRSIIGDKG
jgi:hypothetical protein